MTIMLIALMMGDAALSASDAGEYAIARDYGGGGSTAEVQVVAPVRGRAWTPRVDWSTERAECSAFFSREIEGFGVFRFGPKCADEEVPHAL